MSNTEALRAALAGLLEYAERNECQHESTHRGGAIWTICDDCGRKWSDDRDPFTPYQEPKAISEARAALAQPAASGEPAEDAEAWLLARFGVVRGHPEWRALTEAFNAGKTAAQPAPALVPLTDADIERIACSQIWPLLSDYGRAVLAAAGSPAKEAPHAAPDAQKGT